MPRIAPEGKSPEVQRTGGRLPTRLWWVGRSAICLTAIGLAACAPSSAGPPAEPAVDLAGFRAGPVSVLTQDDVASDAVDPAALAELLRAHGFSSAVVRAYSAGMGGPVRTVRVEVVAFEGSDGADAYLNWLREHASDVIGRVQEESSVDPPGAFVVSHPPSPCCSKEQGVWLAAWRRDSTVVRIEVLGPDVRRGRVGRFVEQLGRSW